jgi:hypothetical protein
MSDRFVAYSQAHHPAPQAGRVSLTLLFYGVWIAPIAWAGNLMATYALSVHACYPGEAPLIHVAAGFGFVWPLILALFLVSLALCASGFVVSFRNWRITGPTQIASSDELVHVEEGRTRYLGVVGMSFSVLFFLITVLGVVILAIIPLCER